MEKEREIKNSDQFNFSPESAIWQLNKERALLLGGPRAILMQIAHPLVCEAVYNHSDFRRDPTKRLKRTLDLSMTIVFGTQNEAQKAADSINKAHEKVSGFLEEPVGQYQKDTPYVAKDPQLLTWVYATLVDSAILSYEEFVRPLNETEKQLFYRDTKRVAEVLGVDQETLPSTVEALKFYIDQMIANDRIVVGPKAKKLLPFILEPNKGPLVQTLKHPVGFITAGLLPEKLREQYGFFWPVWKEKVFNSLCTKIQRLVPYLPDKLRYLPQYKRAVNIISEVA